MGKAQSKRSLDITTEGKKDEVEEGTGKMEKIEDVDQLKPQINGDTHHKDNEATEKVGDTEGLENEKDLSTEKEQKPHMEGGGGGDEAGATVDNKTIENGEEDALNDSKTTESSNAGESGDSSKKPKKEKVKKKWSFRSISFGKKDKQKPPKKEEGAVNGECEKVPEETTEEPAASNKEEIKEEKAGTPVSTDEKAAGEPGKETPKTEESAEPASVTNGTTEPTKESTPAQKISEKVAEETTESNKADAEPSKNVTEEAPKEETRAEPVVVPKQNGPEEPPAAKIEEQPISTTLTESVKEESSTLPHSEEVCDKPSEAKDVPPPAQEGEQVIEKVTVEVKIAPSQEPTVTEQVPQPDLNKEASKVHEPKPIVEEVVVKETSDNKLAETPKAQDSTVAENVSSAPETTVPEQPKESPKSGSEPASEEQKIVEKILTSTDKPDVEINPEQIAETIALIDEVTKEAAEITQQKLESQTTSPTDTTPSTEQTSLEQKEVLPKTSSNAPHPDDSLSKVPETASTTESQIPSVDSNPVEVIKVEMQAETTTPAPPTVESSDAPKEIEKIAESKTDTAGQLDEPKTGVENKPEEIPKTNIEQSESEIKKDVSPKEETTKKDEIVAEGIAPPNLEGSTATNESVTSAKSKENGLEDTHEPVIETSATESLSGQVEHKTVEEIKLEQQQTEKKPDATAEGGAVHVAAE